MEPVDRTEERPSRLSAILSTEFGDCSIVAAQTAMEAEELFAHNQLEVATWYDRGVGTQVEFVTIVDGHLTPSGRAVQLSLARFTKDRNDEPRLYLAAVTRNNIFLPLASFSRRQNSLCDFVQIGDEMSDDENVIASMQDERSYPRKDIIDAIRGVLGTNEEAQTAGFQPFAPEIERQFTRFVKKHIRKKPFSGKYRLPSVNYGDVVETMAVYAACRDMCSPGRGKKGPGFRPTFRPSDSEATLTFDDLLSNAAKQEDFNIFYNQALEVVAPYVNDANTRKYESSQRTYSWSQKRQVSTADIVDELKLRTEELKIKPAFSRSPLSLELFRQAAEYLASEKIPHPQTVEPSFEVGELIHLIELDQQFDRLLGPFDASYEKVVGYVGELVLGGRVVRYVVNETVATISDVDIEIVVNAKAVDATTHRFNITARQVAMSGKPPADLYDEVIKRAGLRQMSPDIVNEVLPYLQKAIEETGTDID